MRICVLLFVASCGASPHTTEPVANLAPELPPIRATPAITISDIVEVSAERPYDYDVRSVQFATTTVVRKEPRMDADKLGVVGRGTRSAVMGAASPGNGCRMRWIHIAPRGWVCETAITPSSNEPTPLVDVPLSSIADSAVPGVYGFVRGDNVQAYGTRADAEAGTGHVLTGSNSVRAAGVVDVDGHRYWQTTDGSLIDESSIIRAYPSTFKGVVIDGGSMPAWVRGSTKDPVKVRNDAGKVTGTIAPRTVVHILEEVGSRIRIDDTRWLARSDVRAASTTPPPPDTAPSEHWFDVDLDEQVLVAYEGDRPVYATMVSTGKWQHETPTVITRVQSKHQSASMISDKGDLYSVADVPWTMYYDGHFALHTSYWHDGFGYRLSHGCINLAPRDARVLYQWSSPDVPAGWTSVYGDEDYPGSLVRVRSRTVPDPPFRGYAAKLHARADVASQ